MAKENTKLSIRSFLDRSGKLQNAPEGTSLDKAFQDQKPAGYFNRTVRSGAGRDGLKVTKEKVYYYDKVAPQAASAPAPAPAPAPPAPKEQSMVIEPVKYSPEIQQAKERVNSYESKKSSSAWDQAQATVQSSFIKAPNSSANNKQYDFSANSFRQEESPQPKEQAQAAQNQLQNNLTKYSKYKSNN